MITGTVKGQSLRISSPTIAADTISYLTARFVFTSDWDGAVKFAHFSCGENNYSVPLTDDEIREGDKLNLGAGTWKVWLHGERYKGGELTQRITTEEALLVVRATGSFEGGPFPTTPSEIERLHAEFDKVKRGVQSDWGQNDSGKPEYIKNKPFDSLGNGLKVDENGVLSAHVAEWKKVIIKDEDVYQDINTVDTLKVNLEDKTEYRIIKIYKLTLMCPDTDYECWMRITTPHNGMPIITFPEQISFIGKKPEFGMDQVWEISIKDGVMIAQKVGDGT